MQTIQKQKVQESQQKRRYLYPLEYHGTNLQNVFTYLSKSLEVLFVLEGIKPVARFPFPEYELAAAEKFCAQHGLFLRKSDYKILKFVPLDRGYANKGYRLPMSSPMIGDVFVYLSKSDALAQEAKAADFMNDHKTLGKLLGYPECCTAFFDKHKDNVKEDDDYIHLALQRSTVKYPELNVIPRYFDVTLLSHFPCTFDCHASLQVALRHLGTIRKHSYGLAEYVMNVLRKPVILTEQDGIHLLFEDKKEGPFIRFGHVESTMHASFHQQLMQTKVINANFDKLIIFE